MTTNQIQTREGPRAIGTRLLALTQTQAEQFNRTYDSALRGQDASSARQRRRKVASDIAELWVNDIRGNADFLDTPLHQALQAGDATDANIGTLSGTVVALKTLELMATSFPVLTRVTTDFSDETVRAGQAITTRIMVAPNVKTYVVGTGWGASSAVTTDVSMTAGQPRAVEFTFDSNTLDATSRKLFDEFAKPAAYSLGLEMVNALYAKLTTANFANTATTKTLADFGLGAVGEMGLALDQRGVPQGPFHRSLLLNASYWAKLITAGGTSVPIVWTSPEQLQEASTIPVGDFSVYKAANLPTTSNLVGFGFSNSALAIAGRLPGDYMQALPMDARHGVMYPVTEPTLGLSLLVTEFCEHKLGIRTRRFSIVYATGAGQSNAGQLLVSA
jgi:hypothetical protein